MTHHMTSRNMVHQFQGTDDMHKLIISNEDISSLFGEVPNQYDSSCAGVASDFPYKTAHNVLMIHPKTGMINSFDFFEIEDNGDIVFYNGWRNNEFFGNGDHIQTYRTRYMGRYKS